MKGAILHFVGRQRELASLQAQLDRVSSGDQAQGRCLLVRGRRRVGKSRLIEEFCTRAGVEHLFFTASRQGSGELALFADEAAQSNLTGGELVASANPQTWDGALQVLASAIDNDTPTVVVVDEFPYLVHDDPSVEATFKKQWDRRLSKKPVLLILVGSDLAVMEALNTHGRAFFQRGTELVVPPLSPPEVGDVVAAADAADAFDAYLVTGGLPLVCGEWRAGLTMWDYLAEALSESTSALIVSAERALAAEFPTETQARAVLTQIGSGETTFTNIARASGGLAATSLMRSLDALIAKRIIAREVPLSSRPSKEARYRVTDPYLRFWLRFVYPHMDQIERGRGDLVLARVRRDWTAWRGKAIEPVVRDALSRLSPAPGLPDVNAVGGYWTRTNTPEVDLIGADRAPVARKIRFAGSIKWLEREPLTQDDINRLIADLHSVSGVSPNTPLVAVSRSGVSATGVVPLGPDDLIAAW